MEIEYLRELVELSRVRSFTKAAARLGLSRAALSKHIAAVECEFGVRAFERDNMHVEVTAAGSALIREAQVLLDTWDGMGARMREYRKLRPLCLKVGLFKGHKPTDDLVETVAENLRGQGYVVDMDLVDIVSPCFQALRDGDVDFISPIHGDGVDLAGLEDELFLEEPLAAIVPAEHPLAAKERLLPDDLSGQVVLASRDGAVRHYFDLLEELLASKGVRARYAYVPYTNWSGFTRSLATMEGGIRLVHASMPRFSMPLTSTRFRVLRFDDDEMLLPIHITWRADDPNPALKIFVDEFKATAAEVDFSLYWG